MTTEQRLERIEENIASLTEAQRRTQSQLNQLAQQVDQIGPVETMSSRVDQFVYYTQRLFTQAGTQITQTEARVERLEVITTRLDRNYREMQSQQQEWRITTNAALERVDRVIDYLVRNINPNSDNS